MVSHAVWKTWPSGLSNDKNLGLQPRFLSTESLGPCFHTARETMIKSYNSCPVSSNIACNDGERVSPYSPWASSQICKIAGCACAGNAGNVFPATEKKTLVSDPGMHDGTCVTHVPWCMSGLLTRGGRKNFTGIPGACAIRNLTYLPRGPCQSMSPFMGDSTDHCSQK